VRCCCGSCIPRAVSRGSTPSWCRSVTIAAKKPPAKKPPAKKPATAKPPAKKPATAKPPVKKPPVRKPAVKKPVVNKPAVLPAGIITTTVVATALTGATGAPQTTASPSALAAALDWACRQTPPPLAASTPAAKSLPVYHSPHHPKHPTPGGSGVPSTGATDPRGGKKRVTR